MTSQTQAQTVTLAVAEDRELTAAELDAANGGITKAGTGTLILSSANTYAGTTTVNQGVLL